MSIDSTLTPKQRRLRADVRAFARYVLSKVGSATQRLADTAHPLHCRQTVSRTGRCSRLSAPPGSSTARRSGHRDCGHAVLAKEFHAVDVNAPLTLLGTMLGLFLAT